MTRIDLQLRPASEGATALGSGFVALDVVDGGQGQFAAAGGSCGNVMTMLAWLGWSSAPVARLGADPAGDFVCEDLKSFGVQLRHVSTAPGVQTPNCSSCGSAQDRRSLDRLWGGARWSPSIANGGSTWLPR
jgi:sugar/nucleoside kinase (ribokinase family)